MLLFLTAYCYIRIFSHSHISTFSFLWVLSHLHLDILESLPSLNKTNLPGILSPHPSGSLHPVLINDLERHSCLYTYLPPVPQPKVTWLLFLFLPSSWPYKTVHKRPPSCWTQKTAVSFYCVSQQNKTTHSWKLSLPLVPNHCTVSCLSDPLLLLFSVFYGTHCLCLTPMVNVPGDTLFSGISSHSLYSHQWVHPGPSLSVDAWFIPQVTEIDFTPLEFPGTARAATGSRIHLPPLAVPLCCKLLWSGGLRI